MDDDYINITDGDRITLEAAPGFDGELSIKIQNTAFVEAPRWLHFSVAGKYDRENAINEMIQALTKLRDGE